MTSALTFSTGRGRPLSFPSVGYPLFGTLAEAHAPFHPLDLSPGEIGHQRGGFLALDTPPTRLVMFLGISSCLPAPPVTMVNSRPLTGPRRFCRAFFQRPHRAPVYGHPATPRSNKTRPTCSRFLRYPWPRAGSKFLTQFQIFFFTLFSEASFF